MKKIQVIFALAAILFAVAGVFASKFPTTTYFRAIDTNFSPGVDCGVQLTTPPCQEGIAEQCRAQFLTQVGEEEEPSLKWYYVSKTVDSNPCEEFIRQ